MVKNVIDSRFGVFMLNVQGSVFSVLQKVDLAVLRHLLIVHCSLFIVHCSLFIANC